MADDLPSFHDVLTKGTDPIGENRFRQGHPAHEWWAHATRLAEEAAYRIDAEFLGSVATDLNDLNQKIANRIVKIFDVWSVRYINVVMIEPMLGEFDAWVGAYAEASLATGVAAFKGSQQSRDSARQDLRHQLSGRLGHWKAEARRFLREAQEAAEIEAGEPQVKADLLATPSIESDPKKLGGPNLSAWLKQRMKSGGFTVRGLSTQSGADSKTINRLLDGEQVRIDVVEKLAVALGATIADCPRD
jgi:hypothetical protein